MLAGGGGGLGGRGFGDVGVDALKGAGRQVAAHGAFELTFQRRLGKLGFPLLADLAALLAGCAPGLQDFFRHHEGLGRPAHGQAGVGDLVVEQGVAVAVGVAFLAARALRDLGLAGDEGRTVLAGGPLHGRGDLARMVAVDFLHGPAIGLEAGELVAGLGDRSFPVDGGVVVVEQHGQLGQLEATGDRGGLVADAFHQAAVAGDHPGAVVDKVVTEARSQVAFGHGHADGGGDALAQRTGGGFNAGGVAVLRVAGGVGAPLTEVADLVHRHGLEAGQVQQRVEQHRAVARREHEAVAVGPVGAVGVVLQEFGPEHRGDIGHAHGHALVPRLSLVDGVHREHADRVGHGVLRCGHYLFRSIWAGFARGVARTA